MTHLVRVLDSPAHDYEAITVSSVAIGFTAAKIANRKGAYLSIEGYNIRYRYDGTDPTATEGHLLYVGDRLQLILSASAMANFKMILNDGEGGDATVRVSYF